MGVTGATSYLDMVQLIADMYDSDFSTIYQALENTGMNNAYDAFSFIENQNPAFARFLSESGDPLAYSYKDTYTIHQGTNWNINSNAINSTRAEAEIPISTTYKDPSSPLSGPEYQAGARTAAAGATGSTVTAVLDKVALGVVGVSIGAKCGCNISQALYDNFPDFWNNFAPGGDPSHWDEIATLLPEGAQGIAKSAINALFGIDKNTNSTTMYLPSEAVAYFTKLMNQQMFFANGGYNFPPTVFSGTVTINSFSNGLDTFNYVVSNYCNNTTYNINPGAMPFLTNFLNDDAFYFCKVANPTGSFGSSAAFEFFKFPEAVGDTIEVNRTYYRIPRIRFYGNKSGTGPMNITYNGTDTTDVNLGGIGHYDTQDGLVQWFTTVNVDMYDAPEGVTHQQGATLPSLSPNDDLATVDQKLRQQFPDWYQNPIYLPTQQPDGSIKDTQYIAIPSISNPNGSETPINQTVGQDTDPTVNPNTAPQDLLETLFRYLNPTPADEIPAEPDTGDGTSPTIITPTGSASTLFKIYNPTQAQLDSFGGWLWSSNFVDQIKKLFNDPMQSIVGIHKVFATPSVGGSTTIHVGYLDSEVPSDWVDEQYTYVDCGTVNLFEVFGNVFDYGPFTTVRIYLPFIGIVPLDVADVMRASINVRYGVDVLTGKCLAMIKVIRDGNAGGVLYQYEGSCICRYPYSSGSYMGIVTSVLGAAMAVGLSGGAGMAVLGATTSIANNFRTNVQQGGSFTGESGAMGGKKPYLIISRPQPKIADRVERFMGWPANYTATLSNTSGFVKVTSCHVETIANATDIEKREIENWLKSGVVIA